MRENQKNNREKWCMKKSLFSHTQTFRKSMGKWVSLNNNISHVYVHTHIHSFDSLIVIFSPIYCRRVDKTYQIFFSVTHYRVLLLRNCIFKFISLFFFVHIHKHIHTYVRICDYSYFFFWNKGGKCENDTRKWLILV